MKKTILSLLACTSLAAAANAQGWLIYGSLGYTTDNTRDINATPGGPTTTDRHLVNTLDFSPAVGYMINDMLTVGIQLQATGSKDHHDLDVAGTPETDVRGFAIGGGPFVRMTKNLGEHFYCFTQVQVSYLNGRTKYETTPSTYDPVDRYDGVSGQLYPAVGIRTSKCMSLAISFGGLGYEYRKTQYDVGQNPPAGLDHTDKVSNFGINFGQQAHLTAQWQFGGGHHMKGHGEPMDDTRHMDTSDDDNGGKKRRRSNDDE